MKIMYELPITATLSLSLSIINELYSESGLDPSYIELNDGTRVCFNRSDYKKLMAMNISDEEYIQNNRYIVS